MEPIEDVFLHIVICTENNTSRIRLKENRKIFLKKFSTFSRNSQENVRLFQENFTIFLGKFYDIFRKFYRFLHET